MYQYSNTMINDQGARIHVHEHKSSPKGNECKWCQLREGNEEYVVTKYELHCN